MRAVPDGLCHHELKDSWEITTLSIVVGDTKPTTTGTKVQIPIINPELPGTATSSRYVYVQKLEQDKLPSTEHSFYARYLPDH